MLQVVFIAHGLAMDAFAVSVSAGASITSNRWLLALRLALVFGLFQAAMPLIGALAGERLSTVFNAYDHWIAFVLLAIIGGRMVREALTRHDCACEGRGHRDSLSMAQTLTLGVATSIDALAVGVSLGLLDVDIHTAVALIGGITFVLCFLGVLFGSMLCDRLGRRAELAGGLVLIAIGVNILGEHMDWWHALGQWLTRL